MTGHAHMHVDEIEVEVPVEDVPPGEGDLDPDDTHVEGTTVDWLAEHPEMGPASWR